MLPAALESVRRARHFTRTTLQRWDLTALEDSMELVASELVTNALRYAADAEHVTVAVEYGPPVTTVTVTDDGRGAPGESHGSGRGLIGMGERAQVFGGTVEAGPLPSGGWRVRAVLPHAELSRPEADETTGGNGDG